jgi:tetratricopeptide (TPR) repeat protein
MLRWIFLSLVFCSGTLLGTESLQSKIEDAAVQYNLGEKTQTAAERNTVFNSVLSLYHEIEEEGFSESGSLNFNIANTYFQLGEYPKAILYYYRAQQQLPRVERIRSNLLTTQNKLKIETETSHSIFHQVLFVYYKLSQSERIGLVFSLSSLAFLFFSIQIFRKSLLFKLPGICISAVVVILFCTATLDRYFSPIEAVLLEPALMYRDAGEQYSFVQDQPLFAGSKVIVLDVLKEGAWLKIRTDKGGVGFIPHYPARLI